MSTYLDELIRSVEAEAAEEEAYLHKLRLTSHRSQYVRRNLNRILQRLRTLKALRKS
jgi:5-bromo-4-chloroindolyl phosphate hydrolysis protein